MRKTTATATGWKSRVRTLHLTGAPSIAIAVLRPWRCTKSTERKRHDERQHTAVSHPSHVDGIGVGGGGPAACRPTADMGDRGDLWLYRLAPGRPQPLGP